MKILGDSQILLFEELFSHIGETSTYSGRTLLPEQLEGVDALITRSTVNVDKQLLANTNVKFVGTCTIGIDHLDTHYLDQQNITWANAAGCNANSVVQYVLSAMAQLAPHWQHSTVGIIGCGNVGGRVYRCLKAFGADCRVYDPFLSLAEMPNNGILGDDLTSLEQVLQADIITSHAPLTHDGPYPTFHMLGEKEINSIRPNSVLISTGRGAVVDNQALLARLSKNKDIHVALDVWEDEPDILAELIPWVDVATPHIAGHSLEGKQNGTVMIYEQLCRFLEVSPMDTRTVMSTDKHSCELDTSGSLEEQLNRLLLTTYPIMQDDQRLRQWQSTQRTLAKHFDYLRKHYPIRHECSHFIFPQYSSSSNADSATVMQKWLDQLVSL